jgi:nitroreductase
VSIRNTSYKETDRRFDEKKNNAEKQVEHSIFRNNSYIELCRRFIDILPTSGREKSKDPCKLTILHPCSEYTVSGFIIASYEKGRIQGQREGK